MAYSITDLCKGCGSCKNACPTSAISGEKKTKHSIDPDKCIECGVCGRICTVEGSVLDSNGNVAARMKRSEWPKPVVIRSICSSCGLCVDICPFNCLTLTAPEAFPESIKSNANLKDAKACVGCALCSDVCPQEAIYLARDL
jgi:formate hydrogenlyase subunit 6/NADH:ubiquinone oxidoreductase subunit I